MQYKIVAITLDNVGISDKTDMVVLYERKAQKSNFSRLLNLKKPAFVIRPYNGENNPFVISKTIEPTLVNTLPEVNMPISIFFGNQSNSWRQILEEANKNMQRIMEKILILLAKLEDNPAPA